MNKVFVASLVFLLGLAIGYFSDISFTAEQMSPGDWIDDERIGILDGGVVLDLPGVVIAEYADTNSMDPVLDAGMHGLEMKPDKEGLQVGDIISYRSVEFDSIVVHRIISIEEDEDGVYYTVKGDNNTTADPEKVRFEQIEGVLVGLLY